MAPRRTSTGRKKIEIRRIEKEAARQVCFSKRRKGLFNKMCELATMCGAQVAAVAFSPGGKAFTFGHPSADSVFDRLLSSNSPEALAAVPVDGGGGGGRNQALEELNRELGELRAQLEAYKVRKEAAEESLAKARAEGCQAAAWLQTEVSQMGEADLMAFAAALEKVRADVAAHSRQVLQDAVLFGRPVHGGGDGGEFELGGTSASGGMAMTQQQQRMMMVEMPPLTGLAAGTEMTQPQEMMAMPPGMELNAGTGLMQQQQMMMIAMPGFAGTEMTQQQMMMAMPPPPPTGLYLYAGTEMTQQQMMMAMPPPPLLPGFAAGMERVHQGFGPQGFPQ